MDEFVETRGWYRPDAEKPQQPRNLALSIALEAGEILECFQWTDEADPSEVAEELADVVLYAAQLANVLKLDLDQAVAEKFQLNESRWAALAEDSWRRAAG